MAAGAHQLRIDCRAQEDQAPAPGLPRPVRELRIDVLHLYKAFPGAGKVGKGIRRDLGATVSGIELLPQVGRVAIDIDAMTILLPKDLATIPVNSSATSGLNSYAAYSRMVSSACRPDQ